MFDVVDLSAPPVPATADVYARVEAIYAARKPPASAILVLRPQIEAIAAGLTRGAASHVIPRANQRWWTCPCREGTPEPCPHAVLYGRVEDRNLVAFVPGSYFDVLPSGNVAPVSIAVENIGDLDAVIRGLDDVGQPGLATMLMVWLEMGLRDALTVALGKRAVS